ncbi:hypothetical protein DTQ70_08865 [Runella sp. SP2]|nr:hypothetical protein DTQ70_08865 [Runella sp. SP2]
MKSGQVIQGGTGPMPTIINGEQVATATLPNLPAGSTNANVEATIHSHPTQVQIENNIAYPQSATLPSPTDRNTFKNYGTNIIVGRLGQSTVSQNPNGSYAVSHQPLGAVIYNSNTQPQIQLTQKVIQKIIKMN